MMLIGLSGYSGSGKDSVGQILVNKHGFQRVAFADKIRETALAINPEVRLKTDGSSGALGLRLAALVHLLGWEQAQEHDDVRRLLQHTGDALRGVFGWDILIHATLHKPPFPQATVVTDVRLPDEALAINLLGGEIWRVERPGVGPINGHDTEIAMDNWHHDVFIHNDDGLPRLEEVVGLHVARSTEED